MTSRKRGRRGEAVQVPKAYPIRHCHRAKFERLSRFPLHALQGFGRIWKRFVFGSACGKSQCSEAVKLFSRGELAVPRNVSVSRHKQPSQPCTCEKAHLQQGLSHLKLVAHQESLAVWSPAVCAVCIFSLAFSCPF